MHVDFSCLFDKGTTLEIPEVVPFRLTPNMRDALGLAGVEGVYRRSCEAAMQVWAVPVCMHLRSYRHLFSFWMDPIPIP